MAQHSRFAMIGAAALAIAVMVCGCSLFRSEEKDVDSVEILLQRGNNAYEKGDYKEALKAFEQLKDWYPFSKHVILAELKIGDSYYHLEQYEDAIGAYQEFAELHPGNEAIPP